MGKRMWNCLLRKWVFWRPGRRDVQSLVHQQDLSHPKAICLRLSIGNLSTSLYNIYALQNTCCSRKIRGSTAIRGSYLVLQVVTSHMCKSDVSFKVILFRSRLTGFYVVECGGVHHDAERPIESCSKFKIVTSSIIPLGGSPTPYIVN